ncbi:MAG: tetratricopeptide repeat protein [Candidatus Hydrogenedentes bacterium]|nr:tetratricopeptide repeat protein [Candidatus Hydrogenedentota bacterium]
MRVPRLIQYAMILLALSGPLLAQAPAGTAPSSFAALSELARLPEADIDLAEAALLIAKGVNPAVRVEHYESKLDGLADELKARLASRTDSNSQLRMMAAVIYLDWGFGRSEVVAPDVFVGFNEVLDQQQWNCFGLTILYITLGERSGIPLRMVAGRGHVFVECDGSPPLYVETTDKGEVHDSKDYLTSYLPFPCVRPEDYRALDKKETVAVVLTQTALAIQHRGNLDLARSYYSMALEFDARSAEAHSGLGFLDLNAGNFEDAIAAFEKAVKADPSYREALGGLGSARYATGDREAAAKAYRNALDLCPDDTKTVYNLAQILYEMDRFSESIMLYRKYTELVPNDPDGYARLAFPLEDTGDLEGALAAYQKALQLNPQYVDAYINMGIVYEKLENFDAARQSFEWAIRLQPDSALAYAGLARVFNAQGNRQQAFASISRAAQIDRANPAVWLDFGAILRDAGDTDRAIESYQRAALLLPDDPEPFEALAELHLGKGDREAAAAAAKRAAELGAKLSPEFENLLQSTRQE